ncbi:MAG: HAD-IIIC family phosphatase [Gammaproteobacteria bacterium]|nr:HAD-IIIC family phosphatase [Gammaproteobacteria bacterium]MDH5692017.1 HAD-IIIC family phosphatase [Gammaproteobacteria bacterium]
MLDKELKKTIKKTTEWKTLSDLVKGLDFDTLRAREVELIYRQIDKSPREVDVKIAYLSNLTIDLLAPYLTTLSCCHDLKVENYIAPFGQYFQELLSPDSGLAAFAPDVIVLDLSLSQLSPQLASSFLSLSQEQLESELNRIRTTISQLVGLAEKNTGAYVLISNFVQPAYPQAGIADLTNKQSETAWYSKLNLALIDELRDSNRAYLVDKNNALARVGKDNITDSKMYYLAKMELNDLGLTAYSHELMRYLIALKGKTKKCVVVDLDNTLWGGVVGEEGAEGVKVGKGYPEGEIFYAFQNYLKTLKQRGFVLAISSKNNPEDAEEVFATRDDMPLALEDFSSRRINWEPKFENIASIAKGLNIGVDSLVFLDDNPVERDLIRSALPQVEVPELGSEPSTYLKVLYASPYFERLFLTEEDLKKVQQYSENAQRAEMQESIGDMDSFLSSLGTEVRVAQGKKETIQRIHQLFSKTNQFNVTTIRYAIPDIEKFISDDRYDLMTVSVKDNFGDLGMVGLVLLELNEDQVMVDSFILSCRAMGRKIESCVMNLIKQIYLIEGDKKSLSAKYIPTQKNKPVAEFFSAQGCQVAEEADGVKTYKLEAEQAQIIDCPGITLILENSNE